MDASLEQLRTLAAVVDEGTFDAAAASLGVTPSAVSQRIKALERNLGRVLVTRNKPVRATPPGEVVLRLARASGRLASDAAAELGLTEGAGYATLPVAVNADSLATWFLTAIARLPARHRAVIDIHVDDQERTAALFASESVLACVTTLARPLPGCTATPLGAMRYYAAAAPDFAEAHLADGLSGASATRAPVVVFNRTDRLQHRFLAEATGGDVSPPAHYVPASADYVRAIRLGLGWGMVPTLQWEPGLVALAPDRPVDVPLYWQAWDLDSPPLRALTAVVVAAATAALADTRPPVGPRG